MSVAEWTPADTQRAQQIWAEYVSKNDVSDRKGQAAGIDPVSGQIWFGESASDIFCKMKSTGMPVPLFFIRVGQKSYLRKGGRR